LADVLRAGVAGGKGSQKWVVEDDKAGWNRGGDVEQADRFVRSR
jgi:hypothetical protein